MRRLETAIRAFSLRGLKFEAVCARAQVGKVAVDGLAEVDAVHRIAKVFEDGAQLIQAVDELSPATNRHEVQIEMIVEPDRGRVRLVTLITLDNSLQFGPRRKRLSRIRVHDPLELIRFQLGQLIERSPRAWELLEIRLKSR